ncbi:dehydrogenase [Salipiger pallidus]|uniref:Dehydrogenase n=1 Tax=Salipiger pallidus TaxID=1775170 RepID=A0A8J2ZKX9_9RHOB|nr:SDR family oxidoreductase [Salipiger pallidus]GGG77254.1 dehydrogenase [Salipiger pallidus]
MDHYILIGAGSGIGAALAQRLAGPGCRLLLHTGSNAARLEQVARDCRSDGAETDSCLGLTSDEALFETVAGWVEDLPEGRLTGLAFAAGYAKRGTLGDVTEADLTEALQAMPLAFQRLCRITAPKLADGRGRILCVSAFGAHRPTARSYAATAPAKAALEAQVRVFAANLAPRGISVNAVVPGYIAKDEGTHSSLTPEQWAQVAATIPMGRTGSAGEVAATAAFLLSQDAGYVTGQSLHVNGGLTL